MKKYILLIFVLLYFGGCENKKPDSTDIKKTDLSEQTNKSLIPLIYKGMYLKTKEIRVMSECVTGKKYIVSPKGEIAIIDTVYNSFSKNNPGKKIYLNIEGFTSVQQRTKEKGFDTVVVVTRLIGTDTTFNCEK